ncbi:hypothetical protein D6821_01580 [Candidatus Parcubacteria bacterium]|nr:MAG: hypothetical protein D6821_01580 [Candidatus Parcubacteria bacterium]
MPLDLFFKYAKLNSSRRQQAVVSPAEAEYKMLVVLSVAIKPQIFYLFLLFKQLYAKNQRAKASYPQFFKR